jgi:hypothetical protein
LNAIAPEVLDSVEMARKSRQNSIKWTFFSLFCFNWYMAFCLVSGTNSGTKISAELKISAEIENSHKKSVERTLENGVHYSKRSSRKMERIGENGTQLLQSKSHSSCLFGI